jgi:DNA (cytosine-5)-methyltransferase 1
VKDKNAKHGVRPFTIREYARLQGVPDDYIFPDKRSSYKIIGNGVPVPMARWVGMQAMRYFN